MRKKAALPYDENNQETYDHSRRLDISREEERRNLSIRYNRRSHLVLTDLQLLDYLLFLIKEMEMSELNDRQQLFCKYYAALNNGAAAYLKAYDCSYDAAKVNASRLLTDDNVLDYIHRLKELSEADRKIMVDQLRNRNLKAIQDNLDSADRLRVICNQIMDGFSNGKPITENWLNAISRAYESVSRLEGKAHERMILVSGLEAAAEEILSSRK